MGEGDLPIKRERQRTEIYSRIVGYIRPVNDWNVSKQQEFNDRKNYDPTLSNPSSH